MVINSQNKLDFIDKTLEIKDPPDFRVISTFSGCGGSSTGYVWAGGKVLLAVEWDDNAVETYRLNYPDTPIYHGDIAKLSVEETLERTGLQVGELDILDGSPPCQGFSTAGKRVLNDPRNQLFREYVRLLKGLQPKVFVMENVSGMVKGKMKLLFAEILTELKACGYQVSAKLLNAMYLGVPQSRQRMIFIGVRNDLEIQPSHPKPMTQPIPIGVVINDLSNMLQDASACHIWQENSKLDNERIRQVPEGGKLANYGYSFNSAYRRLHRLKPAPTLTRGGSIGISTSGSSWYSHYQLDRPLSVREGARIATFPDRYIFTGSPYDGCCRIGNSVPPRMMQYIAEHIKDEILNKLP